MAKNIIAALPIIKDTTSLDIGCGTGISCEITQAKAKFAIDFSLQMVKNAQQQYPELIVSQADATQMDFEDNLFDLVIALAC